MKKIIILACLCSALIACENTKKKAALKLAEARAAFEAGNYNEAKMQIDSIKILYPKAFDIRRQGIYLMQEVELKEQQKTLEYLDSMLAVKQQEFEAVKGKFVLEKDMAYQRIGHYLVPAQVIERNLHRSFLRFQTDETGLVSLTSIYCGSYNIHHTAVKVIAPDGNFAETSVSRDSYETTDLGEHIEKADYKLGEDGGVIAFVAANKDKNLRVDYTGERSYTTHMLSADRQAASDIYELGKTLSSITEIKKNIEEANQKIQFIQKKVTEQKTKTEK
ncbi:hypothetical protein [uncultured Bacteroides sp.]|uniref:hypothetical protein n=1 Tax=uncultured Bacteroides sp. TaxID=162156 RepID=UPI00263A2BA5|nr:hypothetical protein [uncultured Bacteroides sp.]